MPDLTTTKCIRFICFFRDEFDRPRLLHAKLQDAHKSGRSICHLLDRDSGPVYLSLYAILNFRSWSYTGCWRYRSPACWASWLLLASLTVGLYLFLIKWMYVSFQNTTKYDGYHYIEVPCRHARCLTLNRNGIVSWNEWAINSFWNISLYASP